MTDFAGKIELRSHPAASWDSNNPTLAEGELGSENDTIGFKIGDGTTAWTSLPYAVPIQAGRFTDTTDGSGDITLTFPIAFAAAPYVVATVERSSANQVTVHLPSQPTTTTATFRITSNDAAVSSVSVTVHWMAHGSFA